jgi:Flp pilus assembly protein TadG
MINILKRLKDERRGSMAIETALVAPMLIIMTLGTFEVGTIVARQHELQSAANEAEIIISATNSGATIDAAKIKEIIRKSIDLPEQNITVERRYRCNQANGKTKDRGSCPTNSVITNYIELAITDSYTPTWTAFGVGQAVTFSVNRSVLIS